MLDAFIIHRIQQQKNRQRESHQIPLQIEVPRPPPPERPPRTEPSQRDERGVVVVDFTI